MLIYCWWLPISWYPGNPFPWEIQPLLFISPKKHRNFILFIPQVSSKQMSECLLNASPSYETQCKDSLQAPYKNNCWFWQDQNQLLLKHTDTIQLTLSPPIRSHQGDQISSITWCFMPSQPIRLHQAIRLAASHPVHQYGYIRAIRLAASQPVHQYGYIRAIRLAASQPVHQYGYIRVIRLAVSHPVHQHGYIRAISRK